MHPVSWSPLSYWNTRTYSGSRIFVKLCRYAIFITDSGGASFYPSLGACTSLRRRPTASTHRYKFPPVCFQYGRAWHSCSVKTELHMGKWEKTGEHVILWIPALCHRIGKKNPMRAAPYFQPGAFETWRFKGHLEIIMPVSEADEFCHLARRSPEEPQPNAHQFPVNWGDTWNFYISMHISVFSRVSIGKRIYIYK